MNRENVVNVYSHICSKGTNGVYVSELIDKFNIKLNDIRSFVKALDLYEDIHYEIENEDDEDMNITKKTKIIIIGEAYYLKSRYNDYICNLIALILNHNKDDNDIINIIGNRINFKYIDKSIINNTLIDEIKEIKKQILNSIINNKYINITYNCNEKIVKSNDVYALGMYYDDIVNNYYVILNNGLEVSFRDIRYIEELNKAVKYDIKFYINKYLKEKANSKLKLRVYDEAKVVEKIDNIFKKNEIKREKYSDFYKYTIYVDDPYKYKNIINNYGMSVIVEEPIELRQEIITETRAIIDAIGRGQCN